MENKNRVKKVEKINKINSLAFIDVVMAFIVAYTVIAILINKINKTKIHKQSTENHDKYCEEANNKYFSHPYKDNLNAKYKKYNDTSYKSKINSFYSIISRIDGFDTSIFKSNIGNLEIKSMNATESLVPSLLIKMGNFTFDETGKPVIKVAKIFSDESLPHELMHLSSSIYNKNTQFLGFTVAKNDNSYIGLGLTEGYTELLTGRHCKTSKKRCVAYPLEVKYAKIIEYMVGVKEMTYLYSTANLEGLIHSLEKYADRKDIIEFLANLDYLCKNWNTVDKESLIKCREYYTSCNNFCRDLIIKKEYTNVVNGVVDNGDSYERAMHTLLSSNNLGYFKSKLHIKDVNSCFSKENIEELVRSQSLRKSL